MAQDISTYLGTRPLRSGPDLLFNDTTIPQNTNITALSLGGKTQAALELVVIAEDAVELASTATLTVTWEHGSSYASSETVISVDAAADAVLAYAAGAEIARWVIPTDVPSQGRLKIATTDAGATGSVSAWLELISR